jgi:hypothetical protein
VAALATASSVESSPIHPAISRPAADVYFVDPLAFSIPCSKTGRGPAALLTGMLAQECHGYQARMEQQLEALAEQTGLYGCLPLARTPICSIPFELKHTAVPLPHLVAQSWPQMPGLSSSPALVVSGLFAVAAPRRADSDSGIQSSDESPLLGGPTVLRPRQPAQAEPFLALGPLAAPPPGPQVKTAAPMAPATPEPYHRTTPCWPSTVPIAPRLERSDRLIKVPAPVARPAAVVVPDPQVILAPPIGPHLIPGPGLHGTAPLRGAPVPLAAPSAHGPVALAELECQAYPAPPAVIVPGSAGARLAKSSDRQPALLSINHLFPGRRDQAARDPQLEVSPWRSKPVLPPARLPRISLQERNATRAGALKEVRQVLQQQTIDRARRFWRLAPADLKWLALALPVILGVWLSPKKAVSVSVPSPVTLVNPAAKSVGGNSYLEKVFQSDLNFGGFEERIATRSSIYLEEDFSAGLGLWEGDSNWARSWRYDKGGVIHPGRMAIYQPSLPMGDYQLNLTAAVERRSISWMVRASNLRNYIAARLHIAGSGANQRLSFERWTVKEGRVTRRQILPLATTLGTATTVRIQMDVAGSTFTTMLNDQVIDVFTDSSHPSGGVGLFSSDGDQPRIYRLVLQHQHDFFGKLCSFFAPHPITKAGTLRP